jgi:hypothetical protein
MGLAPVQRGGSSALWAKWHAAEAAFLRFGVAFYHSDLVEVNRYLGAEWGAGGGGGCLD